MAKPQSSGDNQDDPGLLDTNDPLHDNLLNHIHQLQLGLVGLHQNLTEIRQTLEEFVTLNNKIMEEEDTSPREA